MFLEYHFIAVISQVLGTKYAFYNESGFQSL